MTTEEMRAAWTEVLRRRAAAPTAERATQPARPPLEDIVALVERRGSEAWRLATLDALMQDAAAMREFELLRAVASARPRRDRVHPLRSTWGVPALASIAAAAVLALTTLPLSHAAWRDGADPVRDAAQGATLLAPATTAAPNDARLFRWRAVPGAREYAFELLAPSGSPVLTARVVDTTLVLPADVRLVPGVTYRWWIAASLADGTELRSAMRELVVSAGG